ncbi:BTAD domain-containing putative transcriptional regulator [Rhodococcus koreensis]
MSHGLWRERLLQECRDATASVTIIVGPAGSGKSTLLSQVAASSIGPVGWYRATEDDSTEDALGNYLSEVVRGMGCRLASGLESIDEILIELDKGDSVEGLLIIDDVHEIAGSEAERALARFVALRPPGLRILLGSRRAPEINLPRLVVSGDAREIDPDQLRFRSWEVEELFATVYGAPLAPEAAARLTRRTGGWAAGLQLFHLATAGLAESGRQRAVRELTVHSRLLRAYLTRNVLSELPHDQRWFMIHTSTLGLMTPALCDALLGITGSGRVLQQLTERQLFTECDDVGRTFRYHEVLRTHLELALLELKGEAETRSWYSRAAHILEAAGEHRQAAHAYAKASDWGAVSRLVREATAGAVPIGDDDPLLSCGEWRTDPWLALALARLRVREGAVGRADEAYRAAQALLDDPEFVGRCESERRALAAWLPGAPAGARPAPHWLTPLRAALCAAPADQLAADPWSGTPRDRFVNGMCALASGEIAWAGEALRAAQSTAEPIPSMAARLVVVVIDALRGTAPDPSVVHDLASTCYREGLPWLERVCRGMQELLLVRELPADWRVDVCAEMVRECEEVGDHWGAALMTFGLALTARCRSDPDAAQRFGDAAIRFEWLRAPVLAVWCRILGLDDAAPDIAGRAQQAAAAARGLGLRRAEAIALSYLAADDRSRGRGHLPLLGSLAAGTPATNGNVRGAGVPQVGIFCFGGFRLEAFGRVIELDDLRPQARTLLRLLSMTPNCDCHRESLEDALWPGVAHDAACHRLQVAVSSVRGLLRAHGMALLRRDESYRLCVPADGFSDVLEFERALTDATSPQNRTDARARVAARVHALDLYTGDLLPEDGPAEFVTAERQRLRRSAAVAAAALAGDHLLLGDAAEAYDAARQAVDLDPYQDAPWRLMVEIHETAGDSSAAARVRGEYRRIRAELGLPENTSPVDGGGGHHFDMVGNMRRRDGLD